MNFLFLSILFFSILLSGSLLFFFGKFENKTLKLILAFSGAYLFSLSLIHLLPDVYDSGGATIGSHAIHAIGARCANFALGILRHVIHIHRLQGFFLVLDRHRLVTGVAFTDGAQQMPRETSHFRRDVLDRITCTIPL